jgi:carboxypeptidase PM20D1
MIRMILIAVGLALAAVAGVVVVRTLAIEPPHPASTAVETADLSAFDGDEAARHLAEAIRFRTITHDAGERESEKHAALDAFYAWLEATYPSFHKAASREVINKSLLYTWPGTDPKLPPVLLMAHADVVPVVPGTEKDWSHDAFAGVVADGFVWGRGALDTKGSLICMMYAAERLAANGYRPARTIMFAFGEDEEGGGGKGNAEIAKLLKTRGTRLAWVLDEGGVIVRDPVPGMKTSVAFINVAEKGYVSLELTAHGKGGHSSAPSDDLAVARVAKAVVNVVEHPFSSGLDDIQRRKLEVMAPHVPFNSRLMLANLWLTEPLVVAQLSGNPRMGRLLHTTIAPTMLRAGVKENVLPPTATAVINLRLHTRDTVETAIAHVRQAIDDPKVDVKVRGGHAAFEATPVADVEGAGFRFVTQTIHRTFGDIPVAPDTMGGRADAQYYIPVADDTLRFWPFHVEIEDVARVHGTDERLSTENVTQGVRFYMRLMKDLR